MNDLVNMNANEPAFPAPEFYDERVVGSYLGLTKRELFAAMAMHAEFLSCGMHKESAEALAEMAQAYSQTLEQRIAINAIAVADALIEELSK